MQELNATDGGRWSAWSFGAFLQGVRLKKHRLLRSNFSMRRSEMENVPRQIFRMQFATHQSRRSNLERASCRERIAKTAIYRRRTWLERPKE